MSLKQMAWPLSSILSFVTLLLLLQSSTSTAQNKGKISINQSLTATINGSSWLSPSGDFAFGFHQFNNSKDLFLLSIWYAKIPETTIVWWANEGHPVPQRSTVKLTDTQGLILSDPQGTQLWNTTSELNSTSVISFGFMNDTGNLVIKGTDNDTVWESFGHPTDTLLPGQIMERGQEVDSRLSETNFTKGRFQLCFQDDGNLVLNARDLTTNYRYGPYNATGTYDSADPLNAGARVVYDQSGYMYLLTKNGSKIDILSQDATVSVKDNYQRATLNFDGVLTWYYHTRAFSSSGWSAIPQKSLPNNICIKMNADGDSGPCGYNSICSLGDDQRPICTCPPNYTLLDPNDHYGSCQPDFVIGCEGQGQSTGKGDYKLVQLSNIDWPTGGNYKKLEPFGEEDCKNSCLNDCFCAVAIFYFHDGKGTCWKKELPLPNGREDSTVSRTAFVKVGNSSYSTNPINPFASTRKKNNKNPVLSAVLGGSVFVNFCLLSAVGLGFFLIYHKKKFRWLGRGQSKTHKEYSTVTCFSYQELKEATDGFKEEIGRGAFGVVYKGLIAAQGSQNFVAVKKLDRLSKDADKEFKTEVNAIGQTHHKNLVRLVGFCNEEDQRLLVYEYMSNGTLADYLFGDLKPSWAERSQIAQGIARGLLYLHEECSTQIIHCDIKPQNILLDDNHKARISDFGLAKLLVLNQTQTNTAIRGTKGYVAPEWFRNKPITVKVDVYSFGVLLLEIICCRKSVCPEIIEEEQGILTEWAFDCYQSGRLDSLVNDDMEALEDRLRLRRFLMVALWCIQEDPTVRPTMRLVTLMLEGHAEVPSPPCPPSFSITTQN